MSKCRLQLICAVLIVLATICGCGGGSGGGGGTIVTSGVRSIVSSDGTATLTVPAGVLNANSTATINPVSPQNVYNGLDTSGQPTYTLNVINPPTRKTALGRDSATDLKLSIKVPAGFNLDEEVIYVFRSDVGYPILLAAVYDPELHVVQVLIPARMLNVAASKAADSTLTWNFGSARPLQPPPVDQARIDTMKHYDVSTQLWVDHWPDAGAVSGKRIAVVVPGTCAYIEHDHDDDPSFEHLADFLANLGLRDDNDSRHYFDNVIGINYNTLAAPDQTGVKLAEQLRPLLAGGAKVYVFAHSLGGLVSRWAIEKSGAQDTTMLVMFGTPNEGIPEQSVESLFTFKLHRNAPSALAMSRVEVTGEFSPFLKMINKPTPVNTNYYVVYGSADRDQLANDNTDNHNGQEHWLARNVFDLEDSDGAVYVTSAHGSNSTQEGYHIKLKEISNSYGPDHALQVNVTHNNLVEVKANRGNEQGTEQSKLSEWIRQQSGTVNLGIK